MSVTFNLISIQPCGLKLWQRARVLSCKAKRNNCLLFKKRVTSVCLYMAMLTYIVPCYNVGQYVGDCGYQSRPWIQDGGRLLMRIKCMISSVYVCVCLKHDVCGEVDIIMETLLAVTGMWSTSYHAWSFILIISNTMHIYLCIQWIDRCRTHISFPQ